MRHRLFGCPRLEEVEGKRLNEVLRERGKTAEAGDPLSTELVPLCSVAPPFVNETKYEWIEEQAIFTGDVYGDGSAKGADKLRRGGSAVGMLRTQNEEELWALGNRGLVGGWCTLGGEDHTCGG